MMPGVTDAIAVEPDYSQPAVTAVAQIADEWGAADRLVIVQKQPESLEWWRVNAAHTETDDATAVEEASPWYAEAVQRIAQLSRLGEKWVDEESDPPNGTAAAGARRVVAALERSGLEPGHIGASSDEGICISFNRDGLYADLECCNSGLILAVTSTRGERPHVREVTPTDIGIQRTVEEIARFIA